MRFSRRNFRPKCRPQKRRLKRKCLLTTLFRRHLNPFIIAIRENNDDGATTTTTTVFFSFLPPNESTTTKTVRHRTRGSDSRLPVRLLRTGTHTFELWTLSLTLSLSLLFIARVRKRDVLLLFLFSMCVYIYTQEEARGNVLWIACWERERSTPTETTLLLRITLLTFFMLS